MPDATFTGLDLTAFCRLEELGLRPSGSGWSLVGRYWHAGSWLAMGLGWSRARTGMLAGRS